jgi:hypothetical protein
MATKYIHIAQIDVAPEDEAEFNRLYDEEHVPRLTAVPGVISGRRFKLHTPGPAAIPRYLAVYELESPDIPQSKAWKEAAETPNWHRVRKTMTARTGGTFEAMK